MYFLFFADFVCCKDLDSNSSCFVLKMYSSLQHLFVFLFDVLSVAVFCHKGQIYKNVKQNMKRKKQTNKNKQTDEKQPTCA